MTEERRPGAAAAIVRSVLAGLLVFPYAVMGILAGLGVGGPAEPERPAWTEAAFAATLLALAALGVLVCVVNGRPLIQKSLPNVRAAGVALGGVVAVAAANLVVLVVATAVSAASNTLAFGGLVVTAPVLLLAWLTWRWTRT